MHFSIEAILAFLSYLVLITSFVVKLRADLNFVDRKVDISLKKTDKIEVIESELIHLKKDFEKFTSQQFLTRNEFELKIDNIYLKLEHLTELFENYLKNV